MAMADRRIYDLRSTFASRANVCHATGLTLAHLLGHANTQILPTYVRPLDENTRALIEAMDTARRKTSVGAGLHQLTVLLQVIRCAHTRLRLGQFRSRGNSLSRFYHSKEILPPWSHCDTRSYRT